jgi:hypothetical protein
MKLCNTLTILPVFFILSLTATAQNSSYDVKQGKTPLAATVDLNETADDWNASLLNLGSEMPRPASQYYDRKRIINEKKLAMQRTPRQALYKMTAPMPLLSKNFDANNANGTPNDNHVSISNDGKIVSVVNQNVFIYNDSGQQLKVRGLSLFASPLTGLNRTFDPKTIYDPIADRFIIVFMNGSESINTQAIVGFSKTNDPTGAWNFYKLPGNYLNDTTWSDYPIITISEKELFLTLNLLKDNTNWKDGFTQSIIWQIDKDKGYAGDSLVHKFYSNIKYNNKPVWSICPVQGGMKPGGPETYFLSVRPGDMQNDTVLLHTLSNTIESGTAALSIKMLRTDKAYGLPPSALQPDGQFLETNDARVLSAIHENNLIQYVSTTIDTNSYNSAVFHGVINLLTPNAPITAQIISSDTLDIAYPSIAYAGGGASDNSSIITFSHVSPTSFPGTSAVFLNRDMSPSDFVRVKSGLNSIDVLVDTNERWGDYTGIQRRYNQPGVVWLSGSYGVSNKTHKTWIAKLVSQDPALGLKEDVQPELTPSLYPNPASHYATIDFELDQREKLLFSVYDVSGRLVKTLYQDITKPGLNRFTFSTEPLQPGVYYLHISNDKETRSINKFVVVR